MTRTDSQRSSFVPHVVIPSAVGFFLLMFATSETFAQPTTLLFETELTSLNLTGGPVGLPLASDPGNALGDSIDGFGFVDSLVQITLSSQRSVSPGPQSLGEACAFLGVPASAGAGAGAGTQCGGDGGENLPPVDPGELDGEPFYVQSFFDVFFDVTVTDVDGRDGRDYASGTSVIQIQDIGPANMQNFHDAIFDALAPNFGLIPPPESAPYIGHFNIVIDLSAVFGTTIDINANGDPDVLKFTLAAHTVDDEGRTFITLPDGTVIDSFMSRATLDGAIQDSSTDPPFMIGNLSGPTTASSQLQNPIVPEPAAMLLLVASGMILWSFSRVRPARA